MKYEQMISQNLSYYINNDKLLLLPFQTLYRILSNSLKENINDNDFFEFLFKCLDKYGRNASILFENMHLMEVNSKYLNKLLTDYNDIFDFHFINPSFLKSIYEYQNEIIKNLKTIENQHKEKIENLIIENEKIKSENAAMKIEFDSMRKEIDELKKVDLENIVNEEVKKSLPIIYFQSTSNSIQLFNGVVHYFTQFYNGNVDEKNIIKVTSSSVSENYLCKHVVDLNDKTSYFISIDEDNQWLKYEFVNGC